MDEVPKFEPYHPVRVSKLESLRTEIAEMSRLEWPLKKIREFLNKERGVKVSLSRLCVYCQSRNIKKGRGEVPVANEPETKTGNTHRKTDQMAAVPIATTEEAFSDLLAPEEPVNPFTKFKPKQ